MGQNKMQLYELEALGLCSLEIIQQCHSFGRTGARTLERVGTLNKHHSPKGFFLAQRNCVLSNPFSVIIKAKHIYPDKEISLV